MEDPTPTCDSPPPHNLRPATDPNSPEFEFWALRNPILPPTTLPSAAELFSGGVLLPLRRFNPDPDGPDPPEPSISAVSGPEISRAGSGSVSAGSRRWKDLFRRSEKKVETKKDKERKREKQPGQLGPGSAAELNINIWPFSRSRSAGNSGSRPRTSGSNRKSTSAPCSRSNSASESKSRKWPSSPGRPGVHVGRASPVWQPKRAGPARRIQSPGPIPSPNPPAPAGEDHRRHKLGAGAKHRVLDLNVSTCIGYKSSGNCGTRAGGASGGGSLFNIRSLFTKKVY